MKLSRLKTLPAVIVIMTAATLGAAASPAAATITRSDGTGAFTAVAVASYVPPPLEGIGGTSPNPCSIYTALHANLAFGISGAIDIRSQAGKTWGEGPEGTYNQGIIPGCGGNPTAVTNSFDATYINSAGNVCSLTGGSYKRGLAGADPYPELNIQFVFPTIVAASSLGCPAATVPLTINTTVARVDYGPVTLAAIATGSTTANNIPGPSGPLYDAFVGGQVYAAACAGLIAPPGCVLRPAGQGSLRTTP